MLNCVIIDDEQFSVDAILKYIDLIPGLNVSGVYTDPQRALTAVSSAEHVDILFMDVDMPNLSGLELAGALRSKTSKLIFTTAHSKYAFGAYEADGDAFLLKPYSFSKFSTTINRLFPEKNATRSNDPSDDYFMVKSKTEQQAIVSIRFDEVVAFETAMNYIKIHLTNGRHVLAYLTFKDVFQLLGDRPGFMQFHRGFVIATAQIETIKGNTIYMTNKISFNVGDSYREKFNGFVDEKLLVTSRRRS
jgi:DNA-binding LytR/AlgR family response regulator